MAEGRYSFPMLPPREICATCAELSITVCEEDLTSPAGWKVKQIYERLIELLLNQSRESMAQPTFVGMDALDFPELHEESVPMIAFLKAWYAAAPPHRQPDEQTTTIIPPSVACRARSLISHARGTHCANAARDCSLAPLPASSAATNC